MMVEAKNHTEEASLGIIEAESKGLINHPYMDGLISLSDSLQSLNK